MPHASGQERTYDLTLSGGMMGSDVWTINGKRYPNTDPLRLRQGDLVRVRLHNMSIEAQPHCHKPMHMAGG